MRGRPRSRARAPLGSCHRPRLERQRPELDAASLTCGRSHIPVVVDLKTPWSGPVWQMARPSPVRRARYWDFVAKIDTKIGLSHRRAQRHLSSIPDDDLQFGVEGKRWRASGRRAGRGRHPWLGADSGW